MTDTGINRNPSSDERVAILIPSLKKGGAEKQASLLARVLSGSRPVTMILTDAGEGFEPENRRLCSLADKDIVCLEGGLLSQYRGLKRVLSERRITLLYCYLTRPDLIGPLAARATGVRRCYQGLRNSALPSWKVLLERIGARYATGAIANSYSGAEVFRAKGIGPISVIPNCYLDPREAHVRGESDTVTVVTVARFVAQKDYPTAIAAMSRAMAADPRLRYTIIGHGELEAEVRKLVDESGIGGRTTILINPPGVLEHVASADIYLSTSLFEGTSNSIMEAMDVSLPVVATDVGDNARLVDDGETGYILPTGDVEGIAAAITTLASDASLRGRMGVCANDKLRREYSYEAFAERYTALTDGHEDCQSDK